MVPSAATLNLEQQAGLVRQQIKDTEAKVLGFAKQKELREAKGLGKGKGTDRAGAEPYAAPSGGDGDDGAWSRDSAANKDIQLLMDNASTKAKELQSTLARLEAAQAEINTVLSMVSVLTTPDKEL